MPTGFYILTGNKKSLSKIHTQQLLYTFGPYHIWSKISSMLQSYSDEKTAFHYAFHNRMNEAKITAQRPGGTTISPGN